MMQFVVDGVGYLLALFSFGLSIYYHNYKDTCIFVSSLGITLCYIHHATVLACLVKHVVHLYVC